MSCTKFESKSPGNTKCLICDENFYRHPSEARDGFVMFQEWHADNFTNVELLEWFQTLGNTREQRLAQLGKIYKGELTATNASGKISPSKRLMGAMLDALDGGRRTTPAPKVSPADNAGQGTAVIEVIKAEGHFVCDTCTNEVSAPGTICENCSDWYASQGTPVGGPAIRVIVKEDGEGEVKPATE